MRRCTSFHFGRRDDRLWPSASCHFGASAWYLRVVLAASLYHRLLLLHPTVLARNTIFIGAVEGGGANTFDLPVFYLVFPWLILPLTPMQPQSHSFVVFRFALRSHCNQTIPIVFITADPLASNAPPSGTTSAISQPVSPDTPGLTGQSWLHSNPWCVFTTVLFKIICSWFSAQRSSLPNRLYKRRRCPRAHLPAYPLNPETAAPRRLGYRQQTTKDDGHQGDPEGLLG